MELILLIVVLLIAVVAIEIQRREAVDAEWKFESIFAAILECIFICGVVGIVFYLRR